MADISKILKHIATTKARIRFLTSCSKQKLIPNGFISRPRLETRRSQHLEHRFAKVRLREQLNHLHAKLSMAQMKLEHLLPSIPEDIKQDMQEYGNKIYHTNHKRLFSKFLTLRDQHPLNPTNPIQYKLDAVLNLSSRHLSDIEIRVLSLGPKFRPSLPEFPLEQYILATEQYIQSYRLEPAEATILRSTVANDLTIISRKNTYNSPKCNLTPREWAAIKALKADQSIIIIPADKGNKTIILDKDVYLQKLQDRVSSHTTINKDPTRQKESAINRVLSAITKTPTSTSQKPIPQISLSSWTRMTFQRTSPNTPLHHT
jgi:AraC-like DNA-binding protein